MIEISPILATKVIHILSGTIWAGFIIVIGLGHTLRGRDQTPEEGRKFRRTVTGRAARIVPPAALVSVISGAYLFVTLHQGLHGPQELTIAIGAIAAILFLPLIALVGRPAEMKLAALDENAAGGRPTDPREITRLNNRVLFAAFTSVALMALSVVAMAAANHL
jgi:hypothetical protein